MTYIQPLLALFVLVGMAGLCASLGGWPKLRRGTGICIVGVFMISWPPAAWFVSLPFQSRYSQDATPSMAGVQAIVVLASYVSPPSFHTPYPLPDASTYARTHHAAWLYRASGTLPVLVCGGGVSQELPFALTMRKILASDGVPIDAIWTEERSRSTHESALYAARMLQEKGIHRIALVTEAYHMLRAEMCFRKQAFQVVPVPCRFLRFDGTLRELFPSAESIRRNELAFHEAVGLLWYWINNRI